MSVLDRSELEQSHLADLHAIASELGIEGYRRLGRDKLIDLILAGGGGAEAPEAPDAADVPDPDDAGPPSPPDEAGEDAPGADGPDAAAGRSRRAPRRRGRRLRLKKDDDGGGAAEADDADEQRGAGGGERPEVVIPEGDDGDSAAGETVPADEPASDDEDGDVRVGVLDVLPGGSGFLREDAFAHSRDDVYVSPAQIRRCELRAGDNIAGPVRPPRRSERYPSLVRVTEVNGGPAEPPAERPLFEDLTPTFATEPLETVHGLAFGKGSRVAIGGPPGAGATRLLREVTDALQGDLDVLVVLAGVRPEEVTEWRRAGSLAIAGGGFDRPADELAQLTDMAVERAKRIVERGGDAVLIIDGLDALAPAAARRAFGAARNTEEAGSLTVVAATGAGGELQRLATTRVVLTPDGALDAASSGTLRAELLGA